MAGATSGTASAQNLAWLSAAWIRAYIFPTAIMTILGLEPPALCWAAVASGAASAAAPSAQLRRRPASIRHYYAGSFGGLQPRKRPAKK
jgi:hypothetical protein